MSDERVELVVDGQTHSGWKSVKLHFSAEELAPSFDVSYSDYSDDPASPLVEIAEGAAVTVMVDGEDVLTGYVDDVGEDDAHGEHDLTIAGRAKTADLVDCTYQFKDTHFRGQTIEQIADALCEPYGIDASLDPALVTASDYFTSLKAPIERFTVEFGEQQIEALTRLARLKGVLLTTNALGDLVMTRPTTVPSLSILRRGQDVKGWSYRGTWRERYSDYHFASQTAGTATHNGTAAAHVKASVSDDTVTRTRRLALLPEQQMTLAQAKVRAEWERNVRAAKSQRLIVTVEGWTGLAGLWQPLQLPRTINEVLGIDDNLTIATVDLTYDREHGHVAKLELVGKGAYDVLTKPDIKRKRKRSRKRPAFAR